MTPRIRRMLLLIAGGVAVWYLAVLFTWALRPLSDSIPVGTDYTLEQPRMVSREVACNTLFDSTSSNALLTTLTPQPKGFPPLEYQRSACDLVQRDARIVFGLDTLGAIVAIGGLIVVATRRPRHEPMINSLPHAAAAA